MSRTSIAIAATLLASLALAFHGFADPQLYGVLVEIQSATADSAPGWGNYFEWQADGVFIDSLFYYADVNEGYAIDFATGVMHLDFGNAVIIPRWADDVGFEHPGCADAENGDLQDINCGHVDIDSDVELSGVVVISPETWYGNSFYVSDPDNPAFGGINIYSIDDITVPAIGTIVDLEGEYEEYRGNGEVVVFDADDITDTGDSVDHDPIALADACDINESHEGMLVNVPALTVTQSSEGADYGFYDVEGCPNLLVAADFFADSEDFANLTGGPGDIVNLTGVVIDEYDEYAIHPRDNLDWDTWNGSR